MPNPVTLDDFSWPTQGAAEAAYRDILRSSGYEVGNVVPEGAHDRMLRQLVDRHPDRDEKVGPGIDHFYIGLTSDGGRSAVRADAIGIWIRRIDGSAVDFSYRTAIRGRSLKSDVKDALRLAAQDLRYAYRDSRFRRVGPVLSDLTGLEIISRDQAQVVYLTPSWAQITHGFAETEGGWNQIVLRSGGGATQIGALLLDPEQVLRWLLFHRTHASLGLATASESAQRPRTDETAWWPQL